MMLMSSSLPPLTQQDILDKAGRLVDKHLQEDKSYPGLRDLLNVQADTGPSLSGLHDLDYPSLAEVNVGLEALSELSVEKTVPLPPELVEQFGRMQCNCLMGLFPEIERAWLTIDSDIFVWKYEDGSDLAYFDGLNEAILCASLLKPKPGIFQPHIQHLLCLATSVDIVLLGVSFARSMDGSGDDHFSKEMHLLPDPLFSIPTDGIYFTAITGTDNGRVFMAGKNGCLYELVYQAKDGWFSDKCYKVNHSTSSFSFLVPSFLNFSFGEDDALVQICVDNSRGILYARTQNGSIQVFDLGENRKGLSKVAYQSQASILNTASAIARSIEKSNFKSIMYISAITQREADSVHLVAITETGVRLYFSTIPPKQPDYRPCTLSLIHVRLPPGFSATSTRERPTSVHTAFYKNGTLMLVSSQGQDRDTLWCISPDSFTFQKQLMEAHSITTCGGKTWAIEEVPLAEDQLPPPRSFSLPSSPSSIRQAADPPCVVTQHAFPPRRFVVLSTHGLHIIQKLRPLEQLRALLLECGGPETEPVKAFFRLHKVDQACAICLVLACSRVAADQQVSDWARMAFFIYGGEAHCNFSSMKPSIPGMAGPMPSPVMYSPGSMGNPIYPTSPMPNMMMSTPVPGHLAGSPAVPGMTGGSPNPMQDVIYSGKHDGIYIFFSRIMRPFWDNPVAMEFVHESKQGKTTYELCTALKMVRDLSDFMEFNAKFDVDSNMDIMSTGRGRLDGTIDEQSRKRMQIEVQRMEKLSLQHLHELIRLTEEVLGLWRLLIDHQFHILAAAMAPDIQNQLRNMSFKTLVTSGKDVCTTLITCLVIRYLNDNATIDAINDRLRTVCPALYSTDDATASKANELLQSAKINSNKVEKEQQLQSALKLLKDVSQPLNLSVICSQLASVHFYLGIVELGLHEAAKVDPQGMAVHFYNNGEPQEDIQGMQSYIARMDCYKCITEILTYLCVASSNQAQVPANLFITTPTNTVEANKMDPQQAEQFREGVFLTALRSDDPLFHAALYEWLFNTNQAEKLLEINTPYVEQYLRRKVNLQTDNTNALDMLWRHYEKVENFPAATRILSQLAERHGTNVSLTQRLEYLSRAVVCAKSSTSRLGTSAGGEFLHELEEKMEVARLQMQIYRSLSNLSGTLHVESAKAKLDAELLDITTLYEEFADPFDLQEVKLAIVHCAGLYDMALIEDLWHNVIDKEINSTAQMVGTDRITTISIKLTTIAKLYVNAERYFPVALILRHLEQKSCELDIDLEWVFKMLLDVGVPFAKLLELYDRLYKSKDVIWQTLNRPLHMLAVLQAFIDHLARNPALLRSSSPPMQVWCLDQVASYLVDLGALGASAPEVAALMAGFKATQARLERL